MVNNKPFAPELVDLKITDYCGFGCAFCYQGSTKTGKHATLDSILNAVDDCVDNQVFEIAIGGGEPTQHPKFEEILKYCRNEKIQANFTTKNGKFLVKKPEILENHSVAFSITTAHDLKVYEVLGEFAMKQFTPQIVAGTVSSYEYEKIVDYCGKHNLRPMLLGYKETGRGKEFKIHGVDTWKDADALQYALRELKQVGVDTAMVKSCSKEIGSICNNLFYFGNEGVVSCYIDAVTGMIGSSSYHLETFKPYESIKKQWKDLPIV